MKKIIPVIVSATLLSSPLAGCLPSWDGVLRINDVPLKEYTVVYDKEDMYATYCAETFASLLKQKTKIELPVVDDETAEVENEILIGKTNRPQSAEVFSTELAGDEFLVSGKDGKVVLYANDYMVGGAAGYLLNEMILPAKEKKEWAMECATSVTPIEYEYKAPTNAIVMIGDGMGDNHIEWARAAEKYDTFAAEQLPHHGKVTTYSYSVIEGKADYTDSAAAATALATGYKTYNAYVGLDHEKNEVKNLTELAYEKGSLAAVVTTDKIQGATPGGFIAHFEDREEGSEILKQIYAKLDNKTLAFAKGGVGNYLLDNTREALDLISADGANFFAMIEEGYIDKHSHNNDAESALEVMYRFHETIAYVTQFVLLRPDTLLLITADHETGGVTATETGFAYTTGSHTNADVSLFAFGKGVEALTAEGICDNIDIPKFIAKAVYGVENFGGPSLK